jgi:pimeloyl-ACP methyl ester carboxylesterase
MGQFWIGFAVVLTVLVLAGTIPVVLRYGKDIRRARQRLASLGSQVIETKCGPVEYVSAGDGYPVLVVHGALGGFDQGLWLAHSFDFSNYRVISVSRFGYLRTPVPPNANLDLQADAYACLLDALEIPKAVVFGISAGSTSSIRFAARHPGRVSALILLSPDAPGTAQMPIPPRFIFDSLLRSDFFYWVLVTYFGKSMRSIMGLVPRGYVLTPEYEGIVKTVMAGDLPVSGRIDGMIFETFTIASEFNASASASSPYPLDRIETPALFIHAADDPIVIPENVRGVADQMPNVHLFVVPGGGHLLFGHREEVYTVMAEFLGENVDERRGSV